MQDHTASRAFAKLIDVRRERRGGDGNQGRVAQHSLEIFGNLNLDPGEDLLARELLRASFVLVKQNESFSLGEQREEESGDLEIDQPAPDHSNAAGFAARG